MACKVLIVDDSALARQMLTRILSREPDLEVVGAAHDPFDAARIMKGVVPDVIVLDIEMPRMDGITFLRRLMAQHPIPTVICSSIAESASPATMAALEAGAVDIVQKPTLMTRDFFEKEGARICDVVRAASLARVHLRPHTKLPSLVPAPRPRLVATTHAKLVAVGSSTGGTDALAVLLKGFGPTSPPVAIVQHMPPGFTATLAKRLDQTCGVRVTEASDGDALVTGEALLCPGDHHMVVRRAGQRLVVELLRSEPVNRHRPSVDVLFDSVAETVGKDAVGVILTGMGDDGARGLLRMREAGAYTLAQDEESCVVYGMPKEAVRRGAAVRQVGLAAMASAVHEASAQGKPAA
jgi:two-component system chemotaxis response regulator CheB